MELKEFFKPKLMVVAVLIFFAASLVLPIIPVFQRIFCFYVPCNPILHHYTLPQALDNVNASGWYYFSWGNLLVELILFALLVAGLDWLFKRQ